MSRFPLGLCLCAPLLVSSCASLMAHSTLTPAVVQQQQVQNRLPPGITNPLQENLKAAAQSPTGPSEVLPAASGPPNRTEVLPTGIELGKPQKFPQSSRGPITVQKPVQETTPHHTVTESHTVAESSSTEVWNAPLESSKHRQIQMSQAGLGSYRILILGSIYGNDPESIELLEAVTREASLFNQSPSYSFLLVQTPNPDGLAEHIRTNHNGVDLNRNFPSTWFTAIPTRLTGPHPASEVETKNLMKILNEFKPHRVLHIRSSIGQRPYVLLNEQLAHAASKIQLQQKIDIGNFAGQYKAGSLEEFVTLRVDAEMMTIQLPPKGFQQLSAKDVFQLATTNFGSTQPVKTEESVATLHKSAPSQTTPVQPVRSILKPDGEKGYVEMLPPPPTGEPFNRASKTTVPSDPKYYELPPPPR